MSISTVQTLVPLKALSKMTISEL